MQAVSDSAELFRHVSAEKASFYRCIMDVFAAAKRQYRLQLRPDEVLVEARWPAKLPEIEEVNAALTQLTAWGNLESHPDTARVSRLSDFYRARYLYRLSQGGEAVESALAAAILGRTAVTDKRLGILGAAGSTATFIANRHDHPFHARRLGSGDRISGNDRQRPVPDEGRSPAGREQPFHS
jgi:hypothetical protein